MIFLFKFINSITYMISNCAVICNPNFSTAIEGNCAVIVVLAAANAVCGMPPKNNVLFETLLPLVNL